jgi:hypothetical protein
MWSPVKENKEKLTEEINVLIWNLQKSTQIFQRLVEGHAWELQRNVGRRKASVNRR